MTREIDMAPALSFPVINMGLLGGEERPAAMELLRDACENWGFFEVPLTHHTTYIINKNKTL